MRVAALSVLFLFSSVIVAVAKNDSNATSHLKTKFYANIYLDLFYHYQDAVAAGDEIAVGQFDVAPSTYSNFGMRISYKYFHGNAEIGLDPNEPIRKLFITYNFFDDHAITIGKDTTIAAYTFGQVSGEENGLVGFGTIGDIRAFMLRYSYDDFEVGLVHTGSDNALNFTDLNSGIVGSENMSRARREQVAPRVEVAYFIGDEDYEVKFFGSIGYYSSIVISPNGSKKRFGAISGLVGLGGEIDISRLTINYSAFFGANTSLYNSLNKYALVPKYDPQTGRLNDIFSVGIAAGLGYKFNRWVTLQAGGGFMGSFSDSFVDKNNKKQFDKDFAVYINLPITITYSFAILPEVAYLNNLYDGNGEKEGLTMYAGVHFIAKF